jgi:hypothetical protein
MDYESKNCSIKGMQFPRCESMNKEYLVFKIVKACKASMAAKASKKGL